MFSREEAKRIRQEFWTTFGDRTAAIPTEYGLKKKWILYHTKIKHFSFKFDAQRKCARVCLDMEHPDELIRHSWFDYMLSFKEMMEPITGPYQWEQDFVLENGKVISRAYVQMDRVSMYNRNHWVQIYSFFVDKMTKLEEFYELYYDQIKEFEKEWE